MRVYQGGPVIQTPNVSTQRSRGLKDRDACLGIRKTVKASIGYGWASKEEGRGRLAVAGPSSAREVGEDMLLHAASIVYVSTPRGKRLQRLPQSVGSRVRLVEIRILALLLLLFRAPPLWHRHLSYYYCKLLMQFSPRSSQSWLGVNRIRRMTRCSCRNVSTAVCEVIVAFWDLCSSGQ